MFARFRAASPSSSTHQRPNKHNSNTNKKNKNSIKNNNTFILLNIGCGLGDVSTVSYRAIRDDVLARRVLSVDEDSYLWALGKMALAQEACATPFLASDLWDGSGGDAGLDLGFQADDAGAAARVRVRGALLLLPPIRGAGRPRRLTPTSDALVFGRQRCVFGLGREGSVFGRALFDIHARSDMREACDRTRPARRRGTTSGSRDPPLTRLAARAVGGGVLRDTIDVKMEVVPRRVNGASATLWWSVTRSVSISIKYRYRKHIPADPLLPQAACEFLPTS
ncbi:hypothetical protein FB451DRAFT_1388033 [Mycena latifolia]|nr:hypothetical protein FB451DRAFT_1388033 [Mycena latifolia]